VLRLFSNFTAGDFVEAAAKPGEPLPLQVSGRKKTEDFARCTSQEPLTLLVEPNKNLLRGPI
jgi:hypothetical protein